MRKSLPYLLTAFTAAGVLGACGTTTDHWAMPDLVGQNLQDAQDQIQHLTGDAVRTTSHDATPADREQDVDRDWKVCNQSAKRGDQISEVEAIDFTVVKTNEKC
jgi:beta-lactam-binding protein with PASTA domain